MAAAEAIRAIGTNGLPYLLAWLDYEPDQWYYQIADYAERNPESIVARAPWSRLTFRFSSMRRAANAMYAFSAIGPIAETAIPELERRIKSTNAPSSSIRALFALSCTGAAAVQPLMYALEDPRLAMAPWAMYCIQNLGTNARSITPVIVSQLTHTNETIAITAAHSVQRVGDVHYLDPDLAVPALIRCLNDPRVAVRQLAPSTLTTFGDAAALALPALTNTLSDPDTEVRAAAARAIKSINDRIGR